MTCSARAAACSMRPPPRPVPEHGQALRPRRAARQPRRSVPGPHSSTPAATTCAAPRRGHRGAGARLFREIRELGYQAARTCSSVTSPRAAPRPTSRPCHPSARPVPARRPAPRDTGPRTGRARLGYDRARVLLKKHAGTPAVRGWTCTSSRAPQPPISAARSPPPADRRRARHRSPRTVMPGDEPWPRSPACSARQGRLTDHRAAMRLAGGPRSCAGLR